MATQLDKAAAERIAEKLRATRKEGRDHELALIEVGGKLICQFGIRRGSRKGQGHDYIPNQIHVTMNQAKNLAACPMSRQEWLAVLLEKGEVDVETVRRDVRERNAEGGANGKDDGA